MPTRDDLWLWVHEAVAALGGEASVVDVAKEIWNAHDGDIRKSGDLFYTWQYDMRWAAQRLREQGKLKLNG